MLADLINQLCQEFKKELVEELKREFLNTIKHSEEDKLFTPEELATYLNVSKDWIYKDGKKLIPYVKLGANLRFRKKDVDQWLDKNTNRPLDCKSGNSKKRPYISINYKAYVSKLCL